MELLTAIKQRVLDKKWSILKNTRHKCLVHIFKQCLVYRFPKSVHQGHSECTSDNLSGYEVKNLNNLIITMMMIIITRKIITEKKNE